MTANPSDDLAGLLRHAWDTHPLWRQLSPAVAQRFGPCWTVERVPDAGRENDDVFSRLGWVLAGEASLEDIDDPSVVLDLTAGDLFGLGATPPSRGTGWRLAAADPNTVLAFMPRMDVLALVRAHPALAARLTLLPQPTGTSRPIMPNLHDSLLGMSVGSLLVRPAVAVTASATVRDAALRMHDANVSSVLVTQQPDAQGALLGVITDRDLRNRVLAGNALPGAPALSIATPDVHTLPAHAAVFDALLLMTRHAIHHVPVLDGDRVLGVLSATRLNEVHAGSPLVLAAGIHRQTGLDGLVTMASQVGNLLRQLAAAEVSAYNTGRMISAVTDTVTVRLIELVEANLGPPPVPYVWVAAGSQARAEQTARTDQDNCLVLDDSFDESRHGRYFDALATWVCDGLHACGYVHCPGGMMAKTQQWRQPRHRWAQYFQEWVQRPDPKALVLTCVFFDLRAVHGQAALLDTLRQDVLAHTRGRSIFLAHMTSNALGHTPALGLFSRLALRRTSDHPGTIDLKFNALVPIVDLARVYALAAGAAAVSTHDRLVAAGDGGEVSAAGARDLREAFELLAFLRIRHQAQQLADAVPADNYLQPERLSGFERQQLKDALTVVQTMQSVMSQRYTAGRF